MMFNIWPYLLRLAIAFNFIYPHGQKIMLGIDKVSKVTFSCISDSVPENIAFLAWHSLFIVLGLLILIWPRPVLPLLIAMLIIAFDLYVAFTLHGMSPTTMLLFVLMLVAFALTIYHSSRSYQ